MGTLQRDQGSLAGVTSAGPWGGISGNAFTPWALPSAAPHAGCEHSRWRRTQERELWNGAQLCPRSKSFTCCLGAGARGFHSEPGGGVPGTQVAGGRDAGLWGGLRSGRLCRGAWRPLRLGLWSGEARAGDGPPLHWHCSNLSAHLGLLRPSPTNFTSKGVGPRALVFKLTEIYQTVHMTLGKDFSKKEMRIHTYE